MHEPLDARLDTLPALVTARLAQDLCQLFARWGDVGSCLDGICRSLFEHVPGAIGSAAYLREDQKEIIRISCMPPSSMDNSLSQEEIQGAMHEASRKAHEVVVTDIADDSIVCALRAPHKEHETIDVLIHLRVSDTCQRDGAVSSLTFAGQMVSRALYCLKGLEDDMEARAQKRLEGLRSEILATLSHEMRTPLAAVKGYVTALLRDDVTWDDETRTEFLQVISDESDKLERMIKNILDMTAAETGTLLVEKRPILLPRLASEVVSKMTIGKPQHRFLLNFKPDFPVIEGDPMAIEQVLYNLLDNAAKYSRQGSLVVITGRANQNSVVISVADQGRGISPEHLNRLFEKYFRVKSGGGGVGLGLPIARQIVEQHGGSIWAESTVGKGTTVYFTLPIYASGKDAQ